MMRSRQRNGSNEIRRRLIVERDKPVTLKESETVM